MNRRTLQRIILEELSSTRPTRRPPRRLGLVDYLGEGSERNLLELSDDAVISTGRSLRELGEGLGDFGYSDGTGDGNNPDVISRVLGDLTQSNPLPDPLTSAPVADPAAPPAQVPAPAPAQVDAVATAVEPAAEPGARADTDTDTRQDAEARAREDADERWAEEAARRNAAAPASLAQTGEFPDDSTGSGDDPEPDPDAPPTINTRAAIDAIDRMAAPAPTTGSVSERRRPSLIDLLYT